MPGSPKWVRANGARSILRQTQIYYKLPVQWRSLCLTSGGSVKGSDSTVSERIKIWWALLSQSVVPDLGLLRMCSRLVRLLV